MGRLAVIINPIAGTGRDPARARAEHAAALLDARRLDGDVFVTERPGHARDLAAAALRRGAGLCVAWGGDGTVNEVAASLVDTDAVLGIVPGGSGNGLARELEIPPDPALAFDLLLSGATRRIDAGELDGRLFVNVAGVGVDARVARAFGAGGRRGLRRYLYVGVRELLTYEPAAYTVTVDGEAARVRPLVVAMANSRQYGNGAIIAPDAVLDDGRLDIVVVAHRSPWRILVQARRLFTGTLGDAPGVSIRKGRTVEVSAADPVLYHVDGEAHVGGTTVRARVRPAALRVAARSA